VKADPEITILIVTALVILVAAVIVMRKAKNGDFHVAVFKVATGISVLLTVSTGVGTEFISQFLTHGRGPMVSGEIVDVNEKPVPGAMISITNIETQEKFGAMADLKGTYSVCCLKSGNYFISVNADGFMGSEQKKVIAANDLINFQLQRNSK